jgi:hypothetical protein
MILGYLFSSLSASNIRARLTRIKVIMILGYLFSSLSASNIGGKTDKHKGDHDTGILVLFTLSQQHRGQD